MSSDNIAIRVENIKKCYEIYNNPRDRLKQFLLPRLKKMFGANVENYFKEFWAVDNISFEIKKGQTLGIIGRNGSGKSTLLQMICGTLTPTSGTINTYGRIAALLELGSGFNPDFTGRENVYLNASVFGLSNAEIDARFNDITEFADIGDFIEQPIKTYSSGMMVRLAFSVIAHVDADILVVDEALAVGDTFFTQKCMRFFREFMKTGTLLFVSHDTGSIKNLCNYAIWLEKGKVIREGRPKEVCELYLEAFYEVAHGKSTSTKIKQPQYIDNANSIKDERIDIINASKLRNDLQIFTFDSSAASFGKGGAQIRGAEITDQDGRPVTWVVGGENVILHIKIFANQDLNSPIVGFYVKDRLGQTLFGDNTYLSYLAHPHLVKKDSEFHAFFSFRMPILPSGDYSIATAVANGSQEVHEQHHWIHDAILFRAEASSISTGLIGIPMSSIKMETIGR